MLGVFAAGCGDDSIALDDLDDKFRDASCRAQVDCGVYPDMETCRGAYASGLDQLVSSVDEGRVIYDADQAGRCLDLFSSIDQCTYVVTDRSAYNELNEACGSVFTGTVEPGGACFINEECLDGECQVPQCPDTCCVGSCVATEPEPEPVAIGGDCSTAPCVDEAYCDVDQLAGTSTCVVRPGEGEGCTNFGDCADGLLCDIFAATSTCGRPAADGETCDPNFAFGLFSCLSADHWCDPADTTCKLRPAPGEACDVEVDNCISYAYCDTTTGLCAELAGPGEACDQVDCMQSLVCVNSVCVVEDESGPVCTMSAG